jgi:uracil-DNA glycosylase family 4
VLLERHLTKENLRVPTWFIANVVGCRPTEQGSIRPPNEWEVKACAPRLAEILKLASPKGIVLLGRTAERYGLPVWRDLRCAGSSVKLCTLTHPAYIARCGGEYGVVSLRGRERRPFVEFLGRLTDFVRRV